MERSKGIQSHKESSPKFQAMEQDTIKPKSIQNVTVYSEINGLSVVRAKKGEYDPTGGSVTLFEPYVKENGGPVQGDPCTIAGDIGPTPFTLKNMEFDGQIPNTKSLFFIPYDASKGTA